MTMTSTIRELSAVFDTLMLLGITLRPAIRSHGALMQWARRILEVSAEFGDLERKGDWSESRPPYSPAEHPGMRLLEALQIAVDLNDLVDLRFFLPAAKHYGIRTVSFDPGTFLDRWPDGEWASISCMEGYHLRFNLEVDRKTAARILREKFGLTVRPSEIYYWVFFHELAHTSKVNEELSAGSWFFKQLWAADDASKQPELRKHHERAQEFADQWATQQFRRWKSSWNRYPLVAPFEIPTMPTRKAVPLARKEARA